MTLEPDSPRPSFRARRPLDTRTAPLRWILRGALLGLVLLGAVGAQSAFAARLLDVVFVLDNSGSMKENDPNFLTRSAVTDFAQALEADPEVDGRIAVVLFDDRARLTQSLAPSDEPNSLVRLENSLASLDFSGQRTNSPAGIERALYELRERGREDAHQAIVFLTDGKIDTGDARNDVEVARWLREDLASESAEVGVRIFGIAFTDDADYQLMQALARRTRARYYRAFAAAELVPVVEDVLGKIALPRPYELAFIEEPTPVRAAPSTHSTDSTDAANTPDVASAPLDAESTGNSPFGLLGLLPVAVLLVGAATYWRRHRVSPPGMAQGISLEAPSAQLLDVGGHLGPAGVGLPLNMGRTTLGRDPHNDIVLPEDTISSEHASIEVRDGRYWLTDLRSTNGTKLADRRLDRDESAPLKGGDHIRFADIDLMFVVEGYVPGGATVYLSSSTTPPSDASVLADASHTGRPRPPRVAPGIHGHEAPGTEPEAEVEDPAAIDDAVFASERERLDPASVLDLDEELGAAVEPASASTPPVANPQEERDEAPSADGRDRNAVERAEAALAAIEDAPQSESEGPHAPEVAAHTVSSAMATDESTEPGSNRRRPVLSLLPDPEPSEQGEGGASEATETGASIHPFDEITAAETIENARADAGHAEPKAPLDDADDPDATAEVPIPVPSLHDEATLPPSASDHATPSAEALRECLDYHLARVSELSPPFESFVTRAFEDEMREALPIAARDLIDHARTAEGIAQKEYTQNGVRYLICGIPGSMDRARELFVAGHGGFTRILTEQLQSESFQRDRCEILALLSFGFDEHPWVSLTIVPDEGQDPRIDLLSYEFLTEAERHEIEPKIDPEISQSGLG